MMAGQSTSRLDERLKQRQGLQARVMDEEMVVLDLAEGQVHHLNRTAGFIWSRFDGKASLAQVVEMVVEEFEVDPGVAVRDVCEVADRLRDVGLLVSEPRGVAD